MQPALLLCDDLFFSSKVESAGQTVGREVVVAVSLNQLHESIRALAAQNTETRITLIVDLEGAADQLSAIQSTLEEIAPEPRCIGYAGHRRTDLMQAARDAGFQVVLTRGQFDEQLTGLLAEE